MKTCPKCRITSDNHPPSQSYCRPCWSEYNKTWREKNPERTKEIKAKSTRKSLYGLSDEAYQAMLVGQNRRCAICGKKKKLVVDHDHATGEVRGLLCSSCNKTLGFAQDSPPILEAAAEYLRIRT